MRSAGLSLAAILWLAACDDAGGIVYSASDAGATMSGVPTPAPAERAAALGVSEELDYACGASGGSAHVTLFGEQDMAAVLIPGVLDEALYLDCTPTRAGPECRSGSFRVLIHIAADSAEFSDSATGYDATCMVLKPQ